MCYKAFSYLSPQQVVQPGEVQPHRPALVGGWTVLSRKCGFTLIELLVVIAIISLLVSIMLPSLQAAKNFAQDMVCTSNLKQIGSAWHLYLVDSEGLFPQWRLNMQWFYGGKHPSIANEKPAGAYPTLQYRPLNPYADMLIRNETGVGLFRCPKDRAVVSPGQRSPTEDYDTYDFFGNSYMMNSVLLFAWDTSTGKRVGGDSFQLSDVQISESQLVLLGDCQWYYSVCDAIWDANFHNYDDCMGLLFLDGHAAFTQIIRGESEAEDYSFSPFRPDSEEEEPE